MPPFHETPVDCVRKPGGPVNLLLMDGERVSLLSSELQSEGRNSACRQVVELAAARTEKWDKIRRKKDRWLIAGRAGKVAVIAVSTTAMSPTARQANTERIADFYQSEEPAEEAGEEEGEEEEGETEEEGEEEEGAGEEAGEEKEDETSEVCHRFKSVDLTATVASLPPRFPIIALLPSSGTWQLAAVRSHQKSYKSLRAPANSLLVEYGAPYRMRDGTDALEFIPFERVRPRFITHVFRAADYLPAIEVKSKGGGRHYAFLEQVGVATAEFTDAEVVPASFDWTHDDMERSKYEALAASVEEPLKAFTRALVATETSLKKSKALPIDYEEPETEEYVTDVIVPALQRSGFLTPVPEAETMALLTGLLFDSYQITGAWRINAPEYQQLFDRNRTRRRKLTHTKFVVHGTSKLAVIIPNGFDLSKVQHCAYGWGLYFTHRVYGGIGYTQSNYLLVVEILLENEPTAKACVVHREHFICSDTNCCVPRFLIRVKDVY